MAAGRIRDLLKDFGFDWDEVAKIVQEALDDQQDAHFRIVNEFKPWALRECNVPWEVSEAIRRTQERKETS